MILKNSFTTSFKTGLFLIVSVMASCREKDTVFEITDLTKKQRFTYTTHTNHWEVNKEIAIEGRINGCIKVAYFYGAPYNFNIENREEWPKYTISFQDSLSFRFQSEEGDGTKHQFVFILGDATKGKVTIKIRTL